MADIGSGPTGLSGGDIELAYESSLPNRYLKNFGQITMNLTRNDLARNARSWIFLESFERFFGLCNGPNTPKNVWKILADEMAYVKSLVPREQFLSPLDYQNRIFCREGRKPLTRIPDMPDNLLARFAWYLLFDGLGHFWWEKNESDAFRGFIGEPSKALVKYDSINCWEMVFSAAIEAGLLHPSELRPAYADGVKNIIYVLQDTFANRMTQYDPEEALHVGDILVAPNVDGPFGHVAAVLEIGPTKADAKIIHLFGVGVLPGISFYWTLGEFLHAYRQFKCEVLRLVPV